jgi:hypothetical protein
MKAFPSRLNGRGRVATSIDYDGLSMQQVGENGNRKLVSQLCLKSPGTFPRGARQMQAGRNVVSSSPHEPHLVFLCFLARDADTNQQELTAVLRLADETRIGRPTPTSCLHWAARRRVWDGHVSDLSASLFQSSRPSRPCFPAPVLVLVLIGSGRWVAVGAGSYGDCLGDGTFGGRGSIGKLPGS